MPKVHKNYSLLGVFFEFLSSENAVSDADYNINIIY